MIALLLSMSIFLNPSDPRLNEESHEVCPCYIHTEKVQSLIDEMLGLAVDNTQDHEKTIMVGLAAPQIGHQDRIILVDTAATGVLKENTPPPKPNMIVMINPEILWMSPESEIWREGCYSTGSIVGLVPRSIEVLVKYYGREGSIFVEEYQGYVARIIQHEVDHLDGIRFPERVGETGILHWVEEKDIKDYRVSWKDWPVCPWEKWLEVRDGVH